MVTDAQKVLFGILDIKKERTGATIADKILFTVTSIKRLDPSDCIELQIEQGYHPAGYGGPDNYGWKRDEILLRYITKWTCSASCD